MHRRPVSKWNKAWLKNDNSENYIPSVISYCRELGYLDGGVHSPYAEA